jgi:uncharacterized membrane protein
MNGLNVFCFATNLAVTVFMGALLPIIPTLTRKSFLFGVKIPPGENDGADAKAMKKRYIAICLAGAAVILAADIVQFTVAPDITVLAVMYFPLLFVAVQFAAFIPQHRAALRLKSERNWRVSGSVFAETKSSFSRGRLSAMPWAWYIIGIFIIFVSTALLLARYPSMPDTVATHYGFDMEPNAWAAKSIGRVMLMPIVNLLTVALIGGTGIIIEKAKLQIDSHKPELSFAQHRLYRRRMGHSLGFLTLGTVLIFVSADLPNLIDGFRMNFWVLNLFWLAPAVALCWVSIASGQGGCKIKISGEMLEHIEKTPEKLRRDTVCDRGDDRFWALGLFYHNPDDPAVFVEDRFGTNLGLNYSHRAVKIGVALFALAMAVFYAWFTHWWLTEMTIQLANNIK